MRNAMRTFQIILLALTILFSASLPTIAQNEPRDKIDVVGYYFVEPPQVAQDPQSAAITLTIAGLPRTFNYEAGLQVVFITEEHNGNNGDINIRINALPFTDLLTRNGEEFDVGQLDAGIIVTATYDGADFRTDYRPRPAFRFISGADLTLTGNAYSVMDTSLPPVVNADLLLGLKAEGINTGDVTLTINSGITYPVLLSNGEQIPSGYLQTGSVIFLSFSNIGGFGFRAINLHPARSLKGQLVASATLSVGDYTDLQRIAWAVESGVTEVSTTTMPGGRLRGVPDDVPNALLVFPNDRFSTSQLGWFMEITKGAQLLYLHEWNCLGFLLVEQARLPQMTVC